MSDPETKQKLKECKQNLQDINRKLQEVEAEAKAIQAQKAQLIAAMKATNRKAQMIAEHAENELKSAQRQPDSERKARAVKLAQLRLAMAKVNLQIMALIETIDPEKPLTPAFQTKIELQKLHSQHILTEYNLENYGPVMAVLEEALGIKKTPAAPAAGDPVAAAAAAMAATPGVSGPLRPGTGQLPRPPVPGVPRPGTGQLPPRPPVGIISPPPRPNLAAAGGVPRPPMPRPMAAGTGRLGVQPPKAGEAQPESALTPAIIEEVKTTGADPAQRDKLKDLLIRVRDLESSLAPMRGDEVGSLSIGVEDASALMRQIAGKVYYINRSLSNLGALGEKIAWVKWSTDPALDRLLESSESTQDAASRAQNQNPMMAGRLRSLFSK